MTPSRSPGPPSRWALLKRKTFSDLSNRSPLGPTPPAGLPAKARLYGINFHEDPDAPAAAPAKAQLFGINFHPDPDAPAAASAAIRLPPGPAAPAGSTALDRPLLRMLPQHAEYTRLHANFRNSAENPNRVQLDRDVLITDEMRASAYNPFLNFGLLQHDIEGLGRDIELFTTDFINKQRMKMAAGGVVKIVAGVVHGATLGLTAPVTGPAFIAGDLLITNAVENLRDRGAPDESGVAVVTGAKGVAVGEMVKAVSPYLKSGLSQIPAAGATLAASFVPIAGALYNVGKGAQALIEAIKCEGFDLNTEQRKFVLSVLLETRGIMVEVLARGHEIRDKSYLSRAMKEDYIEAIREILMSLNEIRLMAKKAIKENDRVIAGRHAAAKMA